MASIASGAGSRSWLTTSAQNPPEQLVWILLSAGHIGALAASKTAICRLSRKSPCRSRGEIRRCLGRDGKLNSAAIDRAMNERAGQDALKRESQSNVRVNAPP